MKKVLEKRVTSTYFEETDKVESSFVCFLFGFLKTWRLPDLGISTIDIGFPSKNVEIKNHIVVWSEEALNNIEKGVVEDYIKKRIVDPFIGSYKSKKKEGIFLTDYKHEQTIVHVLNSTKATLSRIIEFKKPVPSGMKIVDKGNGNPIVVVAETSSPEKAINAIKKLCFDSRGNFRDKDVILAK